MAKNLHSIDFSKHLFLRKAAEKYYRTQVNGSEHFKGKNLLEVVESETPLSFDSLDIFLKDEHRELLGIEHHNLMKDILGDMIRKLNHLAPLKRFFVLETVNLFQSPLSLGKLIPALFLLEGKDQQFAIASFIRPSFLSIKKNIDVLTSNKNLFTPEDIKIERGKLFSFVNDIAKNFLSFFEKDYVESFKSSGSATEMALEIIKENPLFSPEELSGQATCMIADSTKLRENLLHFLSGIQSHDTLYNYAVKRNEHYKEFLSHLTDPEKFKNIEPIEVSLILAGSMLKNGQIEPDDSLILAMGRDKQFDSPEILEQRKRFFNQLSPTCLNTIIKEFQKTFEKLGQNEVSEELKKFSILNITSLLKASWNAFLGLKDKIFKGSKAPFKILFTSLQELFAKFLKKEEAENKEIKLAADELELSEPHDLKNTNNIIGIPKSIFSSHVSAHNYNFVSTNQVCFRGPFFGATKKDYNINFELLQNNKQRLKDLYVVFNGLFKGLQQSEHMKSYLHPESTNLKEKYIAFSFGPYLIALGMTFVMPKIGFDPDKSPLFPYLLLFKKAEDLGEGRVASRKVVSSGQAYNELPMTSNNTRVFYESLYHLLHLLNEKVWQGAANQRLLRFLQTELSIAWNANPQFLYLEEPPKG